ncbi:MAG: ribose 5-phosphate isomerase A [Thermoproteaceae archaeon]|jgi:ribose 5-phosphate isomerase A|nr:ribose 5-phosphate isomerase A [Thermoproteaceae archaeon]
MLKTALAREAARLIKSGMIVGLGSGTTIREFVRVLAELDPPDVLLVPTSIDTEMAAIEAGLGDALRPLWAVDRIDIAVDGADEVTQEKVLLKGRGGAMLREKVVDYAAGTLVILVEGRKLVKHIPERNPVPIEVVPWAWRHVARAVEVKYGGTARLRRDSAKLGPVITDNGNFILDWHPASPVNAALEDELKLIPGVVESGIFSKRRDATILVAGEDGRVYAL